MSSDVSVYSAFLYEYIVVPKIFKTKFFHLTVNTVQSAVTMIAEYANIGNTYLAFRPNQLFV